MKQIMVINNTGHDYLSVVNRLPDTGDYTVYIGGLKIEMSTTDLINLSNQINYALNQNRGGMTNPFIYSNGGFF